MTEILKSNSRTPLKTLQPLSRADFLEWRKRNIQVAQSVGWHKGVALDSEEQELVCESCEEEVTGEIVYILEQRSLVCDGCVPRFQQ